MIFLSTGRAEIGDVDKKNVIVLCAGKRVEVDIFPYERVAVLLHEACDMFGKKPSVMCIVSNGKCDSHILTLNENIFSKYYA